MSEFTLEQLQAMTPSQRHALYKNARRIGGEKAKAALALLEQSGLPYSDTRPVRGDDPLVLRMHDIINSTAGVEAMRGAVESGFPPLAGVDPLIAADLGVDYGKHNETTTWAGQLVWEKMGSLGYKKGPQRPLPVGCVARSAIFVTKGR